MAAAAGDVEKLKAALEAGASTAEEANTVRGLFIAAGSDIDNI